MADPTRPLTLSDLWLRGDVLDGALLRGWNGPVFWFMHTDGDSADTLPSFERIDGIHVQELEPDEAGGRHLSFIPNERFGRHVSFPPCLDFTRPEVRDRAVRVLAAGDPVDDFGGRHCRCGTVHKESACPSCGLSFIQSADLLPIHAAELRGDITPGEAAGLVWCSVLRREAGLGVVQAILGETERLAHITYRKHIAGERVGRVRDGDAAQLALGVALREPGGILLLPLPDGVVGRLDTSR